MKTGILVVMLLTASLTAACAADAMIVMKNFDFSPMDLTIAPGTSVTWKNLDGEPHSVVSAEGLFRSPALDQSDTYTFKFDHAGVFKYICCIHPKMMGVITVH
jgi:plastocyanin